LLGWEDLSRSLHRQSSDNPAPRTDLDVVEQLAAPRCGLVVEVKEEVHVGVGHFEAAPAHDRGGGLNHLAEVVPLTQGAVSGLAEGWNCVRQVASARQEVGERADGRATVDERRQTGLGVVADERADFGATGGNSLAADAHLDGAVVVAQIADLSSGGEIDPFAEVGMPEKAVVILVAEALQDSLLDFAADPAARPEAGAADLAADNPALRTDIAGPLDARKGLHDGAAIEHDGTAARVDHHHRLAGGAVRRGQSLRWAHV